MDKPRHGGHLFAAALAKEGVSHLFTLSGGHVAPLYDGCVDEGIRIVDFRHEQAAAHAADGWARVTGKPGIAAVTAGPGVTDAVTGITNGFYANSPFMVVAGKRCQSVAALHTDGLVRPRVLSDSRSCDSLPSWAE